jgi:hypothetical protein
MTFIHRLRRVSGLVLEVVVTSLKSQTIFRLIFSPVENIKHPGEMEVLRKLLNK